MRPLKKQQYYMKYLSLLKKITPFLVVLLLFSCASRKDGHYQGIDGIAAQENSYKKKFNQMIC
jgi:hypothetical protein